MADEEENKEGEAAEEAKQEATESDEGEGAEGEEGSETLDPPKKKLSKKMIIIIAAVGSLLLLGGIGAGLYFTGVVGGKAAQEMGEDELAMEEEAAAEEDDEGAPVFFPLGDILVNLSGGGKRPNFLKIKVSLELSNEKDVAALETLRPRIIDHFQIYLRELRIEDLRGSAGLYRLREELLLRVTEVVRPVRVRNVLFQEMLVQ